MRSFQSNSVPLPKISDEIYATLAHPHLDIEIGAGQGLHAIRYSQMHPERMLIAMERTHSRFAQLRRRRQDHPNLNNLLVCQADAVSVFVHVLKDQSIERVFLLYPNPYPKAKQANLRWHNMPFMALLRQKMKPGGQLILATNMAYYAAEAEEQMQRQWKFRLHSKTLLALNDAPRSHFEKKYLAGGQSCWNLVFVKPSTDT